MQAAVVLVPRRPTQRGRHALLAIAAPAVALAAGVLLLRLVAGGPHALALVGAVAAPVLAAANRRRAPVAVALWLVAWLAHGLVAQAAGVAVIALAAATVGEIAAAVAPRPAIAAGIVALAVLDVILVWGTPQVGPASNALHVAPLPSAGGHPIPRLQDATFGSAMMGWLDLVAPALLGVVARFRVRASVATGLAGGAWGLLLFFTTTVPATVPTLAGLLAGRL